MKTSNVTAYLPARVYSILLIAFTSCLEPYNPPEITDDVDILVVDGFINSTDNTATVRLSTATPLSDDSGVETGVSALVQIEDENGNSQIMNQGTIGHYSLSQMQLSPGMKYRLSILRNNERRYYSDFITLTTCPPIDSITWKLSTQSEGVNIFVNTHDETGQAKYFQWTFDETWEYTSKYGSYYKLVDGVPIQADLQINRCWITKPSTEIHVNSTLHLSTNIIREFPLMFIPVRSQKVSVRYSMLVQQRTITNEAYDFWTQLKKSTESLGGLFDPLPSQVLGNVYSADDASEPVLGYFSGGEVAKERIFIRFSDLPLEIRQPPILVCPLDSIEMAQLSIYPDIDLIGPWGMPFPIGYIRSSGHNCMDCRDAGGDIIRPEFWD